jgi:hypothetical protein
MTRARRVRRGALDEVLAASARFVASAKKCTFFGGIRVTCVISKPNHHTSLVRDSAPRIGKQSQTEEFPSKMRFSRTGSRPEDKNPIATSQTVIPRFGSLDGSEYDNWRDGVRD